MSSMHAQHEQDEHDDDHGAFVPGPRARRAPTGQGALSGLRFAVKDLIDVAGVLTTGGNPDWAATHSPAMRDAPAVRHLLAAGAALVGKTVTDELAFSLEGANAFHGTPRNPRAPDRLPGGSSSGSAVAVAAGLADFALGTDTGGSVRVPASFCGVFGFRPTHGRVSLDGVLPFAPSYDTVGWFARSGAVLRRAGLVLLNADAPHRPMPTALPRCRFSLVQDAFDMADPACSARLMPLARALDATDAIEVFEGAPQAWLHAYQVLQGAEIWQSLGAWITQHRPRFGPSMAPRFASVAQIDTQDIVQWQAWRTRQTSRVYRMLHANDAGDALPHPLPIWVLPTTTGTALPKGIAPDALGHFYAKALAMTSIAGHAGLPQLTLPLADIDGLPVGLSLIGPPGSDEALLTLAASLDTVPDHPPCLT
jgi:amidase